MHHAKPSRTAFRLALRRAAHQILDHPLVLDDPLALRIVGPGEAAKLDQDSSATLRAFMAVRSRFAEDDLAKAVSRGTKQYVVLGAGLDTFAGRNPHSGLRVFEVDHPATQQWKRELLQAAAIAIPSDAVFVPVDFECETLGDNLERAGFRLNEPAFFSWLGVVPYLSEQAFEGTLSFIAAMPKPSGGSSTTPLRDPRSPGGSDSR